MRLWRGFPPLLVISLALGCAARPSAALELKLSSSLPEQLPYVYPDLRLTLTNRSASAVLFPASGVHVRVLLEHGDGWVECRPVVVSEPAPTGTVKWEGVAAGGEKAIPVPATRCLCYDTRSTDTCREWTDVPGLYRLKAILSTDAQDQANQSTTPAGALRGSLESPPVEIVVRQPTGADAKVISWTNGFSPLTLMVLQDFPTSEYAALVWYGSLRLDTADPVKTRSLIERRLYPGPSSVPDPTSPDRWRSLDSEGVARWQIAWGERVLREHPSFPYRDEVRVLVALSQMSLGMKDEARKTFDDVAANANTAAGRWSKSFLAASGNATDSAPTAPPECDWNSGALGDVVTYGLYLSQGPGDDIWTDHFPLLLLDKQQNYRCLQMVFERGPRIIPGVEAEYAKRAAEFAARFPNAAPPLPTGVDISSALVFLEPVKGREYLIGQIADARWTFTEVAKMADSIWPRRSDVVRRVLMSRLAKPPKAEEAVHLGVAALVRFSKPEDFEFVRSRIDWTEPSTASRLRLSLLTKNGEIAPVVRALGSKVGAESAAAADALLQWGRIDVVCRYLKEESDPKRANDIAGRYMSFRRGDYFGWLPDDVIASIQKAPQPWECLRATIRPSPWNARRDTTKDLAARWYRTSLGEDTPQCGSSELADRFLEFTSGSFDYTPSGFHATFQPYMPGLETCLKHWVEDGGEEAGLPLRGERVTRMTYRVNALALLGELSPGNDRVAAWVRSSMHTWPDTLQNQAVNTLGEIGGSESFAFLKSEALKSEETRRAVIWEALLLIDPERFAAELDSIALAHDQQVKIGSMLITVNHRRAVPALRRLKALVPEKANMYEEYIREFESAGGEAR